MVPGASATEADQLGPLLGKYGENPTRRLLGVFGVVWLVAVGGFLTVAATSVHAHDLAGSLAASALALLGGAAAACLWSFALSGGVYAEIYEHGFTLTRSGVTVEALWSDVASVEERILYLPVSHAPLWRSTRYRLSLANGQQAQIDAAFDRVAELGKVVQRMTTKALLPAAIDAYMAGEPVRFGRFSVGQWGVSNGQETLLWRDLRRMSFEQGVLTIVRSDPQRPWERRLWERVPVAQVPNIYLLTALINEVPRA